MLRNTQAIWRLSRPYNALPPLLSMALGFVVAGGSKYGNTSIIVALVGVALLNFGATLQNDVADKPIDQAAKRKNLFIAGDISADQLSSIAYGMVAVAIGLPLILEQPITAVFVAVYYILTLAYNLPPLQLSRRPLASIMLLAVLFNTLPLLFGFYLVQHTIRDPFILWLALGGFLLRFSVSILKDYKDYEADKTHRKHTFLIVYGPRAVRWTSLGLGTLGYLLLLILLTINTYAAFFNLLEVVALTGLAGYGILLRLKLRHTVNTFDRNNRLFHKILVLSHVFDGGLLLCFFFL